MTKSSCTTYEVISRLLLYRNLHSLQKSMHDPVAADPSALKSLCLFATYHSCQLGHVLTHIALYADQHHNVHPSWGLPAALLHHT